MNPQTITQWLIIGTVAVWIVWDVIAYQWGGTPATISAWWWKAERWQVFLAGVLCGHLFWQHAQSALSSIFHP